MNITSHANNKKSFLLLLAELVASKLSIEMNISKRFRERLTEIVQAKEAIRGKRETHSITREAVERTRGHHSHGLYCPFCFVFAPLYSSRDKENY